ncbi:hypothetical protein P8452_25061 [Trifolium repens]|nr:hypothetical protein P8452_25061 [Trifolium repens]
MREKVRKMDRWWMTDLRPECARDGDRKSPIQIQIAVVNRGRDCFQFQAAENELQYILVRTYLRWKIILKSICRPMNLLPLWRD